MNNSDLDNKIATAATKAELKEEQDKMLKLQVFDSSYFRGKNNFEDDGMQNYLLFQPSRRYFKKKKKMLIAIFQHGNQMNCLMKSSYHI